MKIVRTLAISLFATVAFSAALAQKVSIQVICDDASISKRIETALEARVQKEGLNLSDKLPDAKLFVYAQQNTGSRINTNGWSFAIAHVSNKRTYYVAAKLLKSESKEVKEVEPVLINMLQQEGFMTYLSVIHTDDLSGSSLAQLVDDAVVELHKRVKR